MSKKNYKKQNQQPAAKTVVKPAAKAARKQWVMPKYAGPLLAVGICLLALVAIAIMLLTYENAYLWKVQELNLFLYTKLFFEQQLVVPGGLLTYLGTYFTQYFFHPWQGVLMLCGWWALLMWLTKRAFRIPTRWVVILLIPVALLLLTDFTLGYWIYYLKLRGHFFVATIGTTVAVASVWGYRKLPARWGIRPLSIVAATALLYPLMGFYGLLAAALAGIVSWSLTDDKLPMRGLNCAAAVLSIVFVPQLFYRHVFYQTNIDDIYRAALPLFQISDVYPDYYIPYYILTAFFIILAATLWVKRDKTYVKPVVCYASQFILLAAIIAGTWHFWYKDYNFHKELRMQRCMYDLNWQGILEEASDLQDEPTRAIVMMKNLALFRLGLQGDEMYHYRTGAKAPNTPIPIRMTQVIGRDIYYHYGQLNYCYRWCLEDGVEMGWRAEYLKYLVRCSLLNGEDRVARKYINILKKTKFHREWAEQQEKFLGNEKALKADKGYAPIFHMLNYDDVLASDQSLVEQFLMQHFLMGNSQDPVYQEQALLSALWKKDIETFWSRFFPYAESHVNQHMPIHYQEAAYLYGQLEPWRVDISKMPFDPVVIDTYKRFMEQATQLSKAGNSEEQIRELLFDTFGHTFYFEYYLVRNQKLY